MSICCSQNIHLKWHFKTRPKPAGWWWPLIFDICSLLMGLKEHWVEFTQETSLNGWYFIGALFSLKKYFEQISPTAMLAYFLVSNLFLPRPRKLCSSPEVFLACCRHFICRWCHCFQSVKSLNIVTIMFNHNIFFCGINLKQPILRFMQVAT